MGVESAKLSPEDEKNFRKKEREILTTNMDQEKAEEEYKAFTDDGEPFFLKCIDEIEEKLAVEIRKGHIYTDTKIIARIKDKESALNNDNLEKIHEDSLMKTILDVIKNEDYNIVPTNQKSQPKSKKLDDVFGISIIISPIYSNYLETFRLLKDTERLKKVLGKPGLKYLIRELSTKQSIINRILENEEWLKAISGTDEFEELKKMIIRNPYMLRMILEDKEVMKHLIQNNQFIDTFLKDTAIFDQIFEMENNLSDEIVGMAAKYRVYEILSEIFTVIGGEPKPMDKENYRASHVQLYKNSEEQNSRWPVIECQIKTEREHNGVKEHTIYKVESAIERGLMEKETIRDAQQVQLTPQGIEKVYRTIQQYYENGRFSDENVPIMWESIFDETDEKMVRTKLSIGKRLKEIYKFLDMSSGRGRKEE